MAVIAVVFALLEALGVMGNLVVITVTLCHVVGVGGFVFYLSHMIFHSDYCEVNTIAAFNVLVGLGTMLCILFHVLLPGNLMLSWAFLAVTTALTLGLTV